MLLKAADELKTRGYRLGGMTSQEIREKGLRVGFEIRDYASGRKGWLAHVRQPVGPRIGKYRVNVSDLDSVGARAILDASRDADIVLIDEVGPMELLSNVFTDALQEALDSSKSVLGTIHYRAQHLILRKIRSRKDVDIIEVTQENRAQLPAELVDRVAGSAKTSLP